MHVRLTESLMHLSVLPLESLGSRQEPSAVLILFNLSAPKPHMLAQFTAHIRSSIRQARKNLSIATQTHASLQLARRIAKHPSFRKAKSFAAYIAINGEISLKPLIKLGLAQGKNCYIPVICNNHIYFTAYTTRTKMRTNQFGIADLALFSALKQLNLEK